MPRTPLAVLVAGAALLGPVAAASADSIAYIKDGDVWLSTPDGAKQHRVTADGAQSAYFSPSQADDGTIAVGRGNEILRLRQNGEVINRMDPPALMNSVSHPIDGPPVNVAISPDGTKIAYTLVTSSCPIAGPECGARPATAITPSDRMEPKGNSYTSQPSWVTNDRALTFAGYLHQVNTFDVGAQEDVHWFDDQDLFGQGSSTDQSDGEVNRQGTTVASIRGYGSDRQVMWLKVVGDVARGNRADGSLGVPDVDAGCLTGKTTDLSGPTFSPSGTSLAWREDGAIHVWDDTSRCEGSSRAIIPGGSEPDWGPADINPPAPAPAPPAPPVTTSAPTTSAPTKTAPVAKATLKLAAPVKLRAALSRGITVRLTGLAAGKRTVVARVGGRRVASGTTTVKAGKPATVRVRFTRKAKRSLARRKAVALVLSGGGASLKLTLKR